MQQFIASITSKGQVTLPKKLRERFQIAPLSTVQLIADDAGIRILPNQDITHLAGTFVPKEMKPVLNARDEMEQSYQRS